MNVPFFETIQWEGPEDLDSIHWWLNDSQSDTAGLNALYLFTRETSLSEAVAALGTLDTLTPDEFKKAPYFAILGFIFLASARPFDALYIPKQYEKLADALIEDPKQLRRTIRESGLVGVMPNREALKSAIKFMCDKKILEPLGANEYLIARRPLRGLKLFSK
jgi:hypothetical protein